MANSNGISNLPPRVSANNSSQAHFGRASRGGPTLPTLRPVASDKAAQLSITLVLIRDSRRRGEIAFDFMVLKPRPAIQGITKTEFPEAI